MRGRCTDIREGPAGNDDAEVSLDWWHNQSLNHRRTTVARKLHSVFQRIDGDVTSQQAWEILMEMLKVEGNIGVVAEHMFDPRYKTAFANLVNQCTRLSTFVWDYGRMAFLDRKARNDAYWAAAKANGLHPKRWEDCVSQRDWLHQKSVRIPQFPDPAMASATYSRRG